MNVDYIIVGLGLAGIAYCEQLLKAGKDFVVYEDNSQRSSLVAGGVYNPIILKRFTPVWNAKEQLTVALPFYASLEKKLRIKLDYKFTTKKVFKSIEDQNNWFYASDKPKMTEFMNPTIQADKVPGIIGDYGYGEVFQTGRIDTHTLVNSYRAYLEKKKCLFVEKFHHNELQVSNTKVIYKDNTAKKILFCEGYGLKQNPYFNYLPLKEVKGEVITIFAPKLQVDFLVKSTLFVLPLGDDMYKVGATFNWEDKTSEPTDKGKNELVEKLQKVISVPYRIVDHNAGIRPTVKDRKPLIGVHPQYPSLLILNGLGTRGVMIAPSMADQLFRHVEHGEGISEEINIARYKQKSLTK